MKDIVLETNKTVGVLWFNEIKEGKVDNIENPTLLETRNAKVRLKKANIFEILFLKYFVFLSLVYLLFNINTYYVSMVGMSLSLVFYMIGFVLYKYIGKKMLAVVILTVAVVYIASTLIWFDVAATYNLDFILNYVLQYTFSIFIILHIVKDVAAKGYEGYYKAEGKNLRYARIAQTQDGFEKYKRPNKVFMIGLYMFALTVFLGSTVIGGAGLLKKHAIESKKKELTQEVSTEDSENIRYLNLKSNELGMPRLHIKIAGIQDYEEIDLRRGTELKVIYQDGTVKTATYNNEPRKIKAYVKDNRWNFIIDGNQYTVMNIRAR